MNKSKSTLDGRSVFCLVMIVLILLTVCFIFFNSSKPPEESMEDSNTVLELLRNIIDPKGQMTDDELSFIIRKTAHFVEYAALGFECLLLAYAVDRGIRLHGVIYSAGGCLLTADIDEFIQSFNGRGSMVADVLLDFTGALTGIAVGCIAAVIATEIIAKKKTQK